MADPREMGLTREGLAEWYERYDERWSEKRRLGYGVNEVELLVGQIASTVLKLSERLNPEVAAEAVHRRSEEAKDAELRRRITKDKVDAELAYDMYLRSIGPC